MLDCLSGKKGDCDCSSCPLRPSLPRPEGHWHDQQKLKLFQNHCFGFGNVCWFIFNWVKLIVFDDIRRDRQSRIISVNCNTGTYCVIFLLCNRKVLTDVKIYNDVWNIGPFHWLDSKEFTNFYRTRASVVNYARFVVIFALKNVVPTFFLTNVMSENLSVY